MKDTLDMRGAYVIEALQNEKVVKRWQAENQLTTINKTIRNELLTGTFTRDYRDLMIRYFAFGTDNTPADESQTALGAELFRKPITQMYEQNGSVVSIVSLSNTEANFRIREIGVFCGLTAHAEADSGIMLSRIVVDIDKNSNIVLNIVRTDSTTLG